MARKKSTAATAPKAEQKASAPAPEVENTVVFTGRLVADPELRHTATSGKPVSTIRVAVNDGPKPTFHRVVVWGRTAEVVCQYLRKGRRVQVQGRSQERTWQDAEGAERRTTEVVAFRVQFLSSRESGQPQAESERAVA